MAYMKDSTGRRLDGFKVADSDRVTRRSRLSRAASRAQGRNSLDLGVAASPPTLSTGTASLDASLTKSYPCITSPNVFRTSGGTPTVVSTNFWVFPVVNTKSGSGNLGLGTLIAVGAAVEFMVDADKVQIELLRGTSTRGVMIEIDDQKIQSTSIAWTATGSTMYALLTFAARGIHKIRVEFDQFAGFRGVKVGPTCSVWRPDGADITAAVLGDSIAAQTGATLPCGGFAASLGKLLGWTDVREVALSGSGYMAPGPSACTFGDPVRVSDVAATNPDVIVIQGTPNDNTYTPSQIQAAATATWQAYRSVCPAATIIIGGVFPGASGPSAGVLANEAALKAAYDAWGDPNAFWVPLSTDATGPWVFGTGHVGATASNGNADIYINSADTVHPSQAGHDYDARRWALAIRENILPVVV